MTPWQCPSCKTWMRGDVTEHRCDDTGAGAPATTISGCEACRQSGVCNCVKTWSSGQISSSGTTINTLVENGYTFSNTG